MSYAIRSGRGKAKHSDTVITVKDARKLTQAVNEDNPSVTLSTGRYTVKTTKPAEPANQ